jgi:hypothetical protein
MGVLEETYSGVYKRRSYRYFSSVASRGLVVLTRILEDYNRFIVLRGI